MIYTYRGKTPYVKECLFIAENAAVSGDVKAMEGSSIWFGCSIRGDIEPIRIGKGTNIQDNSVIHTEHGAPAIIGSYIVVGHGAILHGCSIGDGSLIGMGAIILNNAKIGEECIIGAGALVPEGKVIPRRSLALGNPARVIRQVTDEEAEKIREAAYRYSDKAKEYQNISPIQFKNGLT